MCDKLVHKVCGVCGHSAMGKNFGAVSCEPCKSFFRRNALKIKLICHFDNKCKLDVITRKFCSKCRLDKCLAIGMRREWILNDEVQELKRPKTMTNKIQRNNLNNSITNELNNYHGQNTTPYSSQETSCIENHISITSTSDTDFLSEILDDNNFSVDALNQQIIDIETSIGANDCINNQVINTCDYKTNHISTDNHQNSDNYTQNSLTHSYSPKSVGEKVVLGYEMPVIPIGRPIDGHRTAFNETEIHIITELIQSTDFRSFGTNSVFISDNNDFNFLFTEKFDNYVRNVTQAVKGLTAFNTICEDDRILLLKYSCIEMIFLRSILCLNDNADYLRLQRDTDSIFILTMDFLKNYQNIYTSYKNFVTKMLTVWDSDRILINLMYPILLFNPDHCNLVHRAVVKLQQHIYMHLLQRYLLLKYRSESEAKTRFSQFMNILTELNVLRDIQRTHTLDHSLNISPLLQEVFDLKPIPNTIVD